MVIVKLFGGLGNQMFQYAAGRRIAQLHKVPLKLDTSWFEDNPLRTYRLENFRITASIASKVDVAQVKGVWLILGVKGRIGRLIERLKPYYRRSWVIQRGVHFDPNILHVSRSVYLDGYWQSEQYFKEIEDILYEEFKLKLESSPVSKTTADHISRTNSVSLHVRRGDYVSDPTINEVHGVCSLEYYRAAIEQLGRVSDAFHFFVFSDDPQWVQENLSIPYPATFVRHNGPVRDYEDLWLMSRCQNHIIANSSFSWWGAWLCPYPDKTVIAPHKWFNTFQGNTKDLLPPSWLRV